MQIFILATSATGSLVKSEPCHLSSLAGLHIPTFPFVRDDVRYSDSQAVEPWTDKSWNLFHSLFPGSWKLLCFLLFIKQCRLVGEKKKRQAGGEEKLASDRTGFKSWLCYFLSMRHRANCISSLSLCSMCHQDLPSRRTRCPSCWEC